MDAVRQRDRLVQCTVEGAVTLAFAELLVYGLGLWSAVVTLLLGAGLGVVWGHWRMGRSASAFVVFLLARMLCGMGSPLHALSGLQLVACVAMACAISRESERFGA